VFVCEFDVDDVVAWFCRSIFHLTRSIRVVLALYICLTWSFDWQTQTSKPCQKHLSLIIRRLYSIRTICVKNKPADQHLGLPSANHPKMDGTVPELTLGVPCHGYSRFCPGIVRDCIAHLHHYRNTKKFVLCKLSILKRTSPGLLANTKLDHTQ